MNVRNDLDNLSQILTSQTAPNSSIANPSAVGVSKPQVEALATDRTQLSTAATQVAQSAGVSDLRLDKVASIQSALQAGTYHVSASDVAQKMIASLIAPQK